ncbi:MAG TPA: efflux RND transporter periplasmic adaptor subunit, partial [Bryobacteraceae bacterium]|nr:efflux RND transporter periplasmic adaptor subunit [Bryobacteraceae bacterium]
MAAPVRLLREASLVSRGRSWLAILLVGGAAIAAWIVFKKATPPEVDFVKVSRETMVSTLPTNGKVEPIEWLPVRAERTGVITRVLVSKGQQVSKNEPLVELDTRVASAEVSRAQAAIQEAKTQQQVLEQGGRIAERQQTEADLARARLDLEAAQKNYQALQRLAGKQAATQQELDSARQTVDQLQLRIQSLEEHKKALVTGTDKEIARAKLQEAESTAAIARTNLDLSVLRAPMDGTVYDFDLKQGSFVNAGDPIAKVGRLDRVRVTVYVDEPDLGKVRKREVVNITWDALPGHQWKGEVDKLPTQIVPLGTRQVGEVGCVIENPERDLIPNANINAEIQATVVEKALTVPKEAIRREGPETGVFLLQGDRVVWRRINLGVSNYTKSQVLSGVTDADAVALPTEKPLKNGAKVAPV